MPDFGTSSSFACDGRPPGMAVDPEYLLKSLRHSRRPPSSLRRRAKRHAKGLIEKNSLSITIGCLTLIEKPNALVDFAAPRSTSR